MKREKSSILTVVSVVEHDRLITYNCKDRKGNSWKVYESDEVANKRIIKKAKKADEAIISLILSVLKKSPKSIRQLSEMLEINEGTIRWVVKNSKSTERTFVANPSGYRTANTFNVDDTGLVSINLEKSLIIYSWINSSRVPKVVRKEFQAVRRTGDRHFMSKSVTRVNDSTFRMQRVIEFAYQERRQTERKFDLKKEIEEQMEQDDSGYGPPFWEKWETSEPSIGEYELCSLDEKERKEFKEFEERNFEARCLLAFYNIFEKVCNFNFKCMYVDFPLNIKTLPPPFKTTKVWDQPEGRQSQIYPSLPTGDSVYLVQWD